MKKLVALVLIGLMIVSLAACGGKGTPTPDPVPPSSGSDSSGADEETSGDEAASSDIVVVGDEKYNVVFNSILSDLSTSGDPQNNSGYYATKWFFEEVTRRTEGHITFEENYSGALFKTAEVLDALSGGALDMALTTTHAYGEVIPEGFMSNIPGWAEDPYDAHTTFRDTDLWKLYDEALRENGVVPTHMLIVGNYGFISKTPINNMADFKGKLARASGGLFTVWFDALGFSSIPLSVSESYDAMQKGTIDIDSMGWGGFDSFKLGEVAKYYAAPAYHQANCVTHLFSEKFWNTLPQEYQDLILEVGNQAEEKSAQIAVTEQEAKIAEYTETYGLTRCDFEEMDALIASMDVIYDKWGGMNVRSDQMVQIMKDHIAERGV
ncbi:hypothetical protein AGMMS49983_14180 [Clostridia bacterium]|nr:hypothetical protein AGMMS49983_14180 [Clostridia bacterium]